MAISKPKGRKYYITRFVVKAPGVKGPGIRVQESTKEVTRAAAQKYEDKRRSDIRDQLIFGNKPKKAWLEAEKRWLEEMGHKRTIDQDVDKFIYISQFFGNKYLDDIDKSVITDFIKRKESEGVKPATVNRYLALIKAVLNKAWKEWGWIDQVPYIKLKPENNSRERFLTKEEEERLFYELPHELSWLVEFSLATGQRASNVAQARWDEIDLQQKTWAIPRDKSKNNKLILVPLNKRAMNVLYIMQGRDQDYVFGKNGQPRNQCNTRAFRNALKRAGIENFRWHDLRHTWASRHLKNNTPLPVIQKLGGWSNINMVMRYSHADISQLFDAAENVIEDDSDEHDK